MIETVQEKLDFVWLGRTISFVPEEDVCMTSAKKAVKRLEKRAKELHKKSPSLPEAQLSLLLALEFATKKAKMEKRFEDELEELQLELQSVRAKLKEFAPPSH